MAGPTAENPEEARADEIGQPATASALDGWVESLPATADSGELTPARLAALQRAAGNRAVGRLLARTSPPLPGGARSGGIRLDRAPDPSGGAAIDDVGEFLDSLEPALLNTAEDALPPWMSSIGCPWIGHWISVYRTQSAGQVMDAIRTYAPNAADASSEAELIAAVCEQVRSGIDQWRQTGLVPSAATAGAAGSPTLARSIDAPDAFRERLSSGRALDERARARLAPAFGQSVADVRVHDAAGDHAVVDELRARAVTVGNHVAFGPGQYAPGTVIGDALIAHELAHVAQQEGAVLRRVGVDDVAAEQDANLAALEALSGRPRSRRLRTGLALRRCSNDPAQTTQGPLQAPGVAPPGSASPPAGPTAAQIAQAREDLMEDALQAVVQNETRGAPTESMLHTASGVRASYVNATQMIGSAAVGALKQLSATDRAKITNLTVKELDTANSVMFAAGQVWDRIVGGHVASAADAKTSLAALLTKSRLYEDDDLTRMFAFRDFKDAVKAVDADLVDRRKDLTALSDEDLLKHATAGEQPKPGKSLEAGKRPKLIDKIAKREEFSAIAGSDGAKTLGLSANDAETYYHGGAVDIFGEDRAAWQRLAIERPPVKGGTDDLGARIRAAAEAGGGFRLARLNMHAALSKFIADNPLATEDDVARAAAFHNFGSSGSKSAKVYAERISGLFGPIRQARLGGHPVIRAADTDPDGPAAKPKPIPAAPGPAIISRTARGQRPAAAAPAREALASAVLARKRVLARQEKPAPAGDLTEEQALAALAKLSLVMSPSHGAPLSTADQKHHFLRAGKDFFGSFQATLDWFGAIRAVKVPGGVVMHDSAATRLEAVAAVMGTDMPATGGGFELRRPFTEASHFSRLSHHTLGLAVDYDTTDMIRIGSRRIEDGQETSHTADFLEAVTGESTHLDLEPERTLGVSRRQLIKRMGEATAAGKSAADIAGAGDLLQSIADETDRVSQASDDFKDSLGDGHDAFLALRVEYLKPKADRTAVMAKVAPLVKPWITALDDAEKEFHTTAEGCGFDPGKLPSRAAVQAKITERRAIASAAAAMAKRYPAKDGAEPTLSSADQVKLEGWEQTLRLKPGSTTPAKRLDAVEEEALDLDDLQTLTSAESKVKHYADLRTMLVSDGTFLFGTSIRKVADTPSLAQMLESGFFNPGKPGPGAEDRGNFDAKFISEMAKHGFDAGAAWGGAVTDAMHFEQLGPIAKLVD